MPIPDDERFKQYLSEFRPVSADPLPVEGKMPAVRRSWAWAFAAAAVLAIVAVVIVAVRVERSRGGSPEARNPASTATIESLANSQPLTLQQANQMLTHSQSFKAALDDVAFRRQRGDLPKGSQSALVTLGKEDIKL